MIEINRQIRVLHNCGRRRRRCLLYRCAVLPFSSGCRLGGTTVSVVRPCCSGRQRRGRRFRRGLRRGGSCWFRRRKGPGGRCRQQQYQKDHQQHETCRDTGYPCEPIPVFTFHGSALLEFYYHSCIESYNTARHRLQQQTATQSCRYYSIARLPSCSSRVPELSPTPQPAVAPYLPTL